MKNNIFARHMKSSALVIFLFLSFCSNSQAFDFSTWDILIKKHVVPKTVDEYLETEFRNLFNDRMKQESIKRILAKCSDYFKFLH